MTILTEKCVLCVHKIIKIFLKSSIAYPLYSFDFPQFFKMCINVLNAKHLIYKNGGHAAD